MVDQFQITSFPQHRSQIWFSMITWCLNLIPDDKNLDIVYVMEIIVAPYTKIPKWHAPKEERYT